jgi:uncharacterized membrane protein
MSDRERTFAAAMMAVVAVFLVAFGVLLFSVVALIGWALVVLGAISAVHAVLVGLGVVELPSTGGRKDPDAGR